MTTNTAEFQHRAIVEWLEANAEILKSGHSYVPLPTAMLAVNRLYDAMLGEAAADRLASLDETPPQRIGGCVNCGEANDGGYITGFEGHIDEGNVGPFCSMCWDFLREHFQKELAVEGTPQPPSGWQPIETAPKDGTDVLVVERGFVYFASYRAGYGWRDAEYILLEPTLWQPLPQPPPSEEPKR